MVWAGANYPQEYITDEEQRGPTDVEIEFTDRYGGNLPAWIRACLECDATGHDLQECPDPPGPRCYLPGEHRLIGFDGWHSRSCEACDGTGRVPWYVSVARIPRWIVKGLKFFDDMARPRYRAPHMTQPEHIWLVFKCAFIYDLLRLRR